MIVPSYCVEGIFDLEDHGAERANSWEICASFYLLVGSIVHEAGIGPVLSIKTSENENRSRADLVAHCEITWNPRLLVLDIDDLPNILLNVISFTDVSDFLRRKLDSSAENVDKLSIENATSCRVSGHVELSHSDPLVDANIIVFASLVKVLCIVSTDDVNSVFLRFINGCEIGPRVVEICSMFELFVLFHVLKHPVTTNIVLMSTSNTKEPPMIAYNSPAELWNVILEINQIFRLLVSSNVVKVDVLVSPFEVVNNSFISELLFYDENVLEKVDNSLFDVKMIELCNHRLLVFKVSLILVNESISFIYDVSYVVEDRTICAHIKLRELFSEILVFFLLSLKFIVHILNLDVVSLKFAHNELLIDPSSKSVLYFSKSHSDIRELFNMRL